MRRTLLGVAAAIALVVSAGACASQTAPTKAEYAGAANQVCKAADEEIKTTMKEWKAENPLPDQRDAQRFIRFTLIKRLRGMIGQLRSIPPPDGDASYLDSMFRDFEHALALHFSDTFGTSGDGAEQAAETRFAEYGIDGCVDVGDEDEADDTATTTTVPAADPS